MRQRITGMAQAIEARKLDDFLSGVDAGFRGQRGIQHQQLAMLLSHHFRRQPSIQVTLSEITLQIQGRTATVSLQARVSGGGGWLARGRQLAIESRWRKRDGQWFVDRARWQQR